MKKDHNDKESLTLGEFREMTKHLDDSVLMVIDVDSMYETKYREYIMTSADWIEEDGKLYYAFDEI